MLSEVIEKLINFNNLTSQQARSVMEHIMKGGATDSQIAAFLTALRMKEETVEEINGFALAMLNMAQKIKSRHPLVVDTCGTGGDKKNTYNISTTAAFIAAGAGVIVAKHGNRGVSSSSGSADVLEALGLNLNLDHGEVIKCIDNIGIGFIYARKAHAAMARVAGARKDLGIKTIFNVLGPITNPAMATGRVLGVYEEKLVDKVTQCLKSLGIKRALVVYGMETLDEISVSGRTLVSDLNNDKVIRYAISPEDFGLARYRLEELRGGNPSQNARILIDILRGRQRGAKRAAALLNGAAAIVAGGRTDNFSEAITMAKESIDSGKAMDKLNRLIEYSQSH
ncbi:MAG: anthranilate phosphoribosyltransferase [Actinomycetota bacterium]|nr:anthranilate phosphoribosyltransferase [Actinomycetota bacterium]